MWNHVPGVLNPADVPTCNLSDLFQKCWFSGPQFSYSELFVIDKFNVNEKLKLVDVVCETRNKIKVDSGKKGENNIEVHVGFQVVAVLFWKSMTQRIPESLRKLM